MILAPEDYALAQDYIKAIKQQETVLWEGRMIPLDIKSTPQVDEILLIISLILFSVGLSITVFSPALGLGLIISSVLLSSYLFSINKQQKATQYNKLKYNRYLITSKQCIFIHWHQHQIHINTLASNSIKKVQTHRNPNGEISVNFSTKQAVDFEMSYYIDNQNTDFIGFLNIGQQATKVTKIIREQVLREA
jgi:hypothetical protein